MDSRGDSDKTAGHCRPKTSENCLPACTRCNRLSWHRTVKIPEYWALQRATILRRREHRQAGRSSAVLDDFGAMAAFIPHVPVTPVTRVFSSRICCDGAHCVRTLTSVRLSFMTFKDRAHIHASSITSRKASGSLATLSSYDQRLAQARECLSTKALPPGARLPHRNGGTLMSSRIFDPVQFSGKSSFVTTGSPDAWCPIVDLGRGDLRYRQIVRGVSPARFLQEAMDSGSTRGERTANERSRND